MKKIKKIVLAYSGGLDTSVILKWLQEKYKAEIICYTADLGQNIDRKTIYKNAKKLGGYRKDKNYENHKTNIYIRRALRHEATHLVQSCNKGKITGVIKNIEGKINARKLKALNSSVKISGNYMVKLQKSF